MKIYLFLLYNQTNHASTVDVDMIKYDELVMVIKSFRHLEDSSLNSLEVFPIRSDVYIDIKFDVEVLRYYRRYKIAWTLHNDSCLKK